jgi:hypothetical protein
MSGNRMFHLLLQCNKCVYNCSAAKGNNIFMNYFQMEERSEAASYVAKMTSYLILSALHFSSYLVFLLRFHYLCVPFLISRRCHLH